MKSASTWRVKASGVMHAAFGDRMTPGPGIAKMVEAGRLGRKAGKGFYAYHDGHKTDPDPEAYRLLGVRPLASVDRAEVERRLVYIMLNEAALAAAEGVVRSARDGDIGAIFGIGYPPFRGGPLRYMDTLGAADVVRTLRSSPWPTVPASPPRRSSWTGRAPGKRFIATSETGTRSESGNSRVQSVLLLRDSLFPMATVRSWDDSSHCRTLAPMSAVHR